MKTKKLLSLLLALMMMLSVVPMYASAAEPIALSKSNVVTWPTVNGTCYYGQKIGEALTLEGGEVQYNGTVVPGKFVFTNPDKIDASAGSGVRADLTFKPSNSSEYTEFSVSRSRDVKYAVSYGKLTLADINNPPMVTEEAEVGVALSTLTISDGQVVNAYNALEEGALNAIWEWVNPSAIVYESGIFDAKISAANYETLTFPVQVNVKSSVIVPTIETLPAFNDIEYTPNAKYSDFELVGGKAIDSESGTEIAGIFSYSDEWINFEPHPNHTEIDIVFTPNDIETYSTVKFKIPVKINLRQIAFIDNEGNVVEDFTFEVEPGTKMNDIKALITTNLRVPKNAIISVEDNNAYAQNGKKYKLTVNHDDPNYVGKELYFTVKFKNVELTPTITAIGLNAFKVNCGEYKPAGTFTITCNGEEVATVKANQDFNCEVWTDNGGTYEIKAKYNPTENDYFIISDAEWAITVYAKRNLKASAMTYTVNGDAYAKEIRANDIIVAKTSYEDFAHYVIKDGSGKEIVLEGVDLTSREITFAMPDHDLTIEIKTNKQIEMEEAAANCDHICHSDNPLFQMLWKVLTFIFRLFDVQQYCDCGNLHYDAPLFG